MQNTMHRLMPVTPNLARRFKYRALRKCYCMMTFPELYLSEQKLRTSLVAFKGLRAGSTGGVNSSSVVKASDLLGRRGGRSACFVCEVNAFSRTCAGLGRGVISASPITQPFSSPLFECKLSLSPFNSCNNVHFVKLKTYSAIYVHWCNKLLKISLLDMNVVWN